MPGDGRKCKGFVNANHLVDMRHYCGYEYCVMRKKKNAQLEFTVVPDGEEGLIFDVLGQAYEYLIKKFADATNKKAGPAQNPVQVQAAPGTGAL